MCRFRFVRVTMYSAMTVGLFIFCAACSSRNVAEADAARRAFLEFRSAYLGEQWENAYGKMSSDYRKEYTIEDFKGGRRQFDSMKYLDVDPSMPDSNIHVRVRRGTAYLQPYNTRSKTRRYNYIMKKQGGRWYFSHGSPDVPL